MERRLRVFSYEVRQGGFAQLLFNMRGENLAAMEDMLIAVGAPRAQDFYVRAIREALADRDAYRELLSDWHSAAAVNLRSSLQLLSVEYLTGGPSLEREAQGWFS